MFNKLLPAIEDDVISASGSIPVVIEGIEHIYDTGASLPDMSYHNSHELLYLREGKIEASINGETITLDKGKILIIRPLTRHKLIIKSRKADMFNLYFGFVHDTEDLCSAREGANSQKGSVRNNAAGPSVMIPGSMAQIPLENFLQFADLGVTEDNEITRQPYFVVTGSEKKEISILAERIVDEMANSKYSKDFMIHTLTVELMIHLARAMRNEWEESLRVKNGKAKELVLIAKQYMDDNFERGITVAEAAQYVFLSQGYFTRAFRDELSISPMNYLMQKRIDKACELLENNEIKVSSIAVQSGFSSPQRFNVAFRKLMGMTPMEYRKMHSK
ncbi:MAG: AraC family transcriptional regulator [Saccharofermentans sp.]|jgi:AraC-like DNA-binding protein|nr:AraC family transcriptional regulator [Mageeibacillus sp.]MCI1264761.1 AraC family transcriptional regulator [Saccharofermentans sp.]MCI1275871.1 AraC family transcriptional regulator [Saccharofermentans sp.]MCI1769671.1 AraC family transcriptional regulator [Mageeibacillus sp.]MCI2044321.1 AraC family transcriptional regulator [Mageeibacillus sp.]